MAQLVAAATGGGARAIREALSAIQDLPSERQGRTFTLGICRTFTIEAQLEALTLGLAMIPSRPRITVADLENIEQSLLDPGSPIMKAQPDAVLVLWRLEELHPRLAFEHDGMTSAEREDATTAVIQRIERLCASYEQTATAPLFLSTLPEFAGFGKPGSDLYARNSPRRAILRINQALLDLAADSARIHLFDFSGWASAMGVSGFDMKLDLYARQPIANRSMISFAGAVAGAFAPLLRPPAKVLALDLDNVLWGGVLGEDGLDGVKIGHDFPGNVYRRIQLRALALKRRGVLLALVSKNNLADVEQAFATLRDMPLKLEDFVVVRVDWREKHVNLREMAEELNVGLDSFVFVDDQAFEREQMLFNVPDVRVLEADEDPLRTLRALMNCADFDTYRLSEEDRRRSDDYAAQALRKRLSANAGDSQQFLSTLELRVLIDPVTEATVARAAQMLAKTNQFNVTTRRHMEADLRRMMADPANILLQLSMSDRFGDQGIVGLAIAIGDLATKVARVDSFLLSCRAIGRGAELALWSSLLTRLSRMNYSKLLAEYVRTAKNQQVADLFERFGMRADGCASADHARFVLELPSYPSSPEWLDVQDAG